MPKIIFKKGDGDERIVEAPVGTSIMLAALNNNVEEIEAECGGSCMCATCHIYVDDAWIDKIPPIQIMESDMLEEVASERRKGSRLSCQIEMEEALDGVVVELPDFQV